MTDPQLIIFEDEFKQINSILQRLVEDAQAKIVFLVDRNGQLIASAGEKDKVDALSIASLAAGNIAATSGLAKILGQKEFTILFHEGEKDHIHLSLIGSRIILVVIFDNRTSLGLVRLRVKKASDLLTNIFDVLLRRSDERLKSMVLPDLTEEDIDKLFNH